MYTLDVEFGLGLGQVLSSPRLYHIPPNHLPRLCVPLPLNDTDCEVRPNIRFQRAHLSQFLLPHACQPGGQEARTHAPHFDAIVAQNAGPLPHQHVESRLRAPIRRHGVSAIILGPSGVRSGVDAACVRLVEDFRFGQGRRSRGHEDEAGVGGFEEEGHGERGEDVGA